jgi:hypothetical protein
MFLNFRRKKLLILRDNEIGPGTDFSQEKAAFAFIQNVFELPGKKLLILRDNEIGPGTDFSQEKIAFAFIQNVFEFPGKKVVHSEIQ